jgi:hypothetical protein
MPGWNVPGAFLFSLGKLEGGLGGGGFQETLGEESLDASANRNNFNAAAETDFRVTVLVLVTKSCGHLKS